MTAEIARYEPALPAVPALIGAPLTDSWIAVVSDVAKLAAHIADTEFVPDAMRGKPAAVAAAILAGREVGIGPMAALQNIHIIKGKPGQSAQLMRQLVLARGHEIRYVDVNDSRCVVEGRRRGEQEWTRVSFTADQAKRAQISLGGYPEDKLVARATVRLARRKFADCIGGMPYAIEELEDGDVPPAIEAPPSAPSAAPEEPKKRTAQRRTRTNATPAAQPTSPPATTEAPTGPPLPGEPGYDEPDPNRPVTDAQLTKLHTVFTTHGVEDRDERLDIASRIVRRQLTTSKELTVAEAGTLIDTLERIAGGPDEFSAFLAKLIEDTEPAEGELT